MGPQNLAGVSGISFLGLIPVRFRSDIREVKLHYVFFFFFQSAVKISRYL